MQKIAINNPKCSQKNRLTLMGTEHKYVKIGPGPIVPNNLVAAAEQKHNLNSCEVGVEVLKMAGAD